MREYPRLHQSLKYADSALWELDVPDIKEMCNKASELIRKAQDFNY
jgi:hypothetical protein